MRYVSYNTVRQAMGDKAHTVQDLGQFLGRHPHSVGIVGQLYKQNISTALLDTMFNVHQLPKNKDKYKAATDMVFEWGLDVNKVKQVRIVENVTTAGNNGADIIIKLEERYYNPNETFKIEGSRDLLFVTMPPRRNSLNQWEYVCRFVTDDIARGLDLNFAKKNNMTRFVSNHHAEMSDKGYYKLQSNVERHRNYLTLHRVETAVSGQYAIQEDRFIEHVNKKGKETEVVYYKLSKADAGCLDQFYEIRNNNLLFGRSNFNKDGKCLLQEADGRDIPMGDGIVTQLERYAEKYAFNQLTTQLLRDVISAMKTKSQYPTGNHYVVLCNEKFQEYWWSAMVDELKTLQLPATAFYSKGVEGGHKAGNYKIEDAKEGGSGIYNNIGVGANFTSYNYNGNVVTIAVERAMTQEYGDRAYGIFIDVTHDLMNGRPAMELFTLEGAPVITGQLNGLGGKSGSESGLISTPIHGYQYIVAGYAGAAVYNPYRSFIMEEAVTQFI
jgi:hypothetical protein